MGVLSELVDFYDFPGAHDTHDVCHGYTIRGCCMLSHYRLFYVGNC